MDTNLLPPALKVDFRVGVKAIATYHTTPNLFSTRFFFLFVCLSGFWFVWFSFFGCLVGFFPHFFSLLHYPELNGTAFPPVILVCRLSATGAINRKQAEDGLRHRGRSGLVMGCQVLCCMKLAGLFEALSSLLVS